MWRSPGCGGPIGNCPACPVLDPSLGSRLTWLGTQHKVMSILATFKKTDSLRITIPIKGCSSFMDCKAWSHESESVKIIHLDATESLICSRALMIAQTSTVNRDGESGSKAANGTVPAFLMASH